MSEEPPFSPARVVDAWDETPRFRAISVDLGSAAPAYRTAGQVVRLRAPLAAEDSYFALASAPGQAPAEFLIKRGGLVGDALIAASIPGGTLESTPPFGRGFPTDGIAGNDILLFAAGSGIAPIRGLAKALSARKADLGKIVVYYGQRHPGDFAYEREHERWRSAGVEVFLCCTHPAGDWQGETGRVHEVAQRTHLAGVRPDRALVYLCGMKQMVVDAREMLAGFGIAADRTFLNF